MANPVSMIFNTTEGLVARASVHRIAREYETTRYVFFIDTFDILIFIRVKSEFSRKDQCLHGTCRSEPTLRPPPIQ
jgi:hypothetical protein